MSTTNTQTKWVIDPTHSEVQFKIKHLVISTVTGKFRTFSGELITTSDDFTNAEISFEAETSSVDTNQEQRDGHLKSDEFFASEKYPKLTFKSTSLQKTGADTYKLQGDLTIRDITKPVTLDVEYGGTSADPYGNTKAGFDITGKIHRKEFGLTWDAVTEAGSIVVSDEVKLILSVQLVKQA